MSEDKRDYGVEETARRENIERHVNRVPESDSTAKSLGDTATDPWMHRSAGMRCNTCMWFVEKKAVRLGRSRRIGRCRKHAPSMNGYPVVFANDWCGDHKLDEEKA